MNFFLFAWLIVTIIALIVWVGLIGLIASIEKALRKERSVSHLIWRAGGIIAAIPCILWLGIFTILLGKYLYTFPDRQAIRRTYQDIVQAVEKQQYATAYALMSPTYRERYSLQDVQNSSRLDWVLEDNERRTPDIEWNKISGRLIPSDETGLVLLFVKHDGTWYMKEETEYWLD